MLLEVYNDGIVVASRTIQSSDLVIGTIYDISWSTIIVGVYTVYGRMVLTNPLGSYELLTETKSFEITAVTWDDHDDRSHLNWADHDDTSHLNWNDYNDRTYSDHSDHDDWNNHSNISFRNFSDHIDSIHSNWGDHDDWDDSYPWI